LTEFRIAFERTIPLSVFAICGSCSALGSWNPQAAVVLQTDDCTMLWEVSLYNKRNYCRHLTFKLQTIDGPCEVIVHTWETHLQPRSITPLGMGINCICLRHMHKIANMLHIGLEGLIIIDIKYLNFLMFWRYKLFLCTTWTLLSKKPLSIYIHE
uniref:CBM20 domain-containing protein n=1 Tax=Pavo cristatus TaxID=9049 RepID=A0A8C9FP21_PAVCR